MPVDAHPAGDVRLREDDIGRHYLRSGRFELRVKRPSGASAEGVLVDLVRRASTSGRSAPLERLVELGFIAGGGSRSTVSGRFAGLRLIHAYREEWRAALVGCRLYEPDVADDRLRIGNLVVQQWWLTSFAPRTAGPVLTHDMGPAARALLEEFVAEEAQHGAVLRPAVDELEARFGDRLRTGCNLETALYADGYELAARRSPAHFAASLIVSEVPERAAPSARAEPTFEILADRFSPASAVGEALRLHQGRDETGEHARLPVELLSALGEVSASAYDELQLTVRSMLVRLRHFLEAALETDQELSPA